MGLQMVMISLSMIAMLSLVNSFGTETAAAFGAVLQLWNYVQMPAMAVGAACSTMAAQNVGAGLWPRVDAVTRTGIAANFLMTGLLIVLLILFDRWTPALFLPEGSATLEVARHLNHIAIWSFLLFGVSFVVSGVVRATGAVTPPLLILAFSLWGVRVPLANVLLPHLGADAVWWSFPISSSCSMLLSLAYYRWRLAQGAHAGHTHAPVRTGGCSRSSSASGITGRRPGTAHRRSRRAINAGAAALVWLTAGVPMD